jgi:hypothetical protein
MFKNSQSEASEAIGKQFLLEVAAAQKLKN